MDIAIFVIVFLAVLTQSVTGFGLALVAMGLLSRTLGVQTTAPLIALIAVPLEFALLVRHRQAVKWRPVWRLSLAALVGIPIGILGLKYVNERIVLTILGLVIVAYAVYALRVPGCQSCAGLAGPLGSGSYRAFWAAPTILPDRPPSFTGTPNGGSRPSSRAICKAFS